MCTSDLDSLFIIAPDVFALCENMCKSDFETPVGGEINFATRAHQLNFGTSVKFWHLK